MKKFLSFAVLTAMLFSCSKPEDQNPSPTPEEDIKALCFSADDEHTVSLSNKGGNTPSLQYSYDGDKWIDWNYSELHFGTEKCKHIYIRGDNPNGFSSSSEKYSCFVFSKGGQVQCQGNIMHLLSYSKDLMIIPCAFCFHGLFGLCYDLVSAPALPATTLTPFCYSSMFGTCTSLQTAPELPATTLANGCYIGMFSNCTSLITAPELPATTLSDECYSSMFSNCTSLQTAPALPATTLALSCYDGMFNGCTSFETTPELSATTLAFGCYLNMFARCTGLKTTSALPATTLAVICYKYMFYGCSSLTIAPELPATTLADGCYMGMFSNCTSLQTAPALPATTLAIICYQEMFRGCSILNKVTCLAEEDTILDYTDYWLDGVSSTGTFVKSPKCSSWPNGRSGIPEGWKVVDYSPE